MAAMTTALTEFSNNGNSRTTTLSAHTACVPRIVIEKRKIPANVDGNATYEFKVVYGTEDAAGENLTSKIAFSGKVNYPLLGKEADITAALAVFRDIIAGDEFANSVSTQEWLS